MCGKEESARAHEEVLAPSESFDQQYDVGKLMREFFQWNLKSCESLANEACDQPIPSDHRQRPKRHNHPQTPDYVHSFLCSQQFTPQHDKLLPNRGFFNTVTFQDIKQLCQCLKVKQRGRWCSAKNHLNGKEGQRGASEVVSNEAV